MTFICKRLLVGLVMVVGLCTTVESAAQSQPPDFDLGLRQAESGLRVSSDLQLDLLLKDP
jgi:hypothetical protein